MCACGLDPKQPGTFQTGTTSSGCFRGHPEARVQMSWKDRTAESGTLCRRVCSAEGGREARKEGRRALGAEAPPFIPAEHQQSRNDSQARVLRFPQVRQQTAFSGKTLRHSLCPERPWQGAGALPLRGLVSGARPGFPSCMARALCVLCFFSLAYSSQVRARGLLWAFPPLPTLIKLAHCRRSCKSLLLEPEPQWHFALVLTLMKLKWGVVLGELLLEKQALVCSGCQWLGHRAGFLISGYTPFFGGCSPPPTTGRTRLLDFCVWVLSETLGNWRWLRRDPLWLANCPNMHILNVNMLKKCYMV